MNHDKNSEVKRTGHIYDGIEELDHPTPNWFQAIFYVTIAFGLGYLFYYTIGDGKTLNQEYEKAKMNEAVALYEQTAKTGGPKSLSEEELLALLKNPERKKSGDAIFQTKCASCHGNLGQGGIGPNLTDAYWLHGRQISQILSVVRNGVSDKGMPPWGAILTETESVDVAVFVRTLEGTKPAGAKAPQGDLIKTE